MARVTFSALSAGSIIAITAAWHTTTRPWRRAFCGRGPRCSAYLGIFLLSLALFPFMGLSFFPRTDPGQFVINVKAPSGTRLELTDKYIARVEDDIRSVVPPEDLGMIVSNIGITPDFSAIYTSNSGQHTAFVQVSLKEGHSKSSFAYMNLVRAKLRDDLPELSTYFQTGGLVDAVVNLGLPAPIDIQVSGNDMQEAYATASSLAASIRKLQGVSDVLIPQDIDYPGIQLNVNREMAGKLGLSSSEIVDNVITSLTSNAMIAPSYWVDPKSGNNYFLTVQFPETQIQSMTDFAQIPVRASGAETTNLGAVTEMKQINTPTEVDHYQLRRVIDVYVSPSGQDLGGLATRVDRVIAQQKIPDDLQVKMRGSVEGMRRSFSSFGVGLVALGDSRLPDSDGTVRVVHRPDGDSARHSAGNHRSHPLPAGHGNHAERDVSDGSGDDDRNRGLQLDSDRGVHS